jgi:methionine-rich copper-binding protein CopC
MRPLLATRGLAALGIAALTGAAMLLSAAPAWAHSYLVDSTPAEGETLTELPDAFSVTANETLLDLQSDGSGGQGAFGLVIRDADGGYYGDGCVSVVDATMSTDPVLGASGDYTMIWQVVSADGHPVSGEIPFTWEAPAGFEPATSHETAPVCGEDPASSPTPVPGDSGSETSPWVFPITVVLGILVLLLALRSARLQMRNRAANRDDGPPERPAA